MEWLLSLVLVGFPLLALAAAGAYAYHDAPKHDMDPRKWAAISFFIPFFGFFAYLFERDERTEDTSGREEMFVDGPFQIHKSRADDAPFVSSPKNSEESTDTEDEEVR